jgi:hypothetical protein
MQEQQQQEQAKKRSKSKSPATSIRGIRREKSVSKNDTTQAKFAPTTPPVVIQTHEEVKVNQGSGANSGEQRELDKLKFDLNQTLRELNLENYKTDQIVKVKGVVVDFCKGKLADLNKVRVIFLAHNF